MTKKNWPMLFLLPIIIIFFFYFFDLQNIEALRQGTEGFYLQISKEMYLQKSFLTPLHMGNPHWSKPPLHFWMAHFFYFLSSGTSLAMARFSIAVFSLSGLFLYSRWMSKRFQIPTLSFFCFMASTLAFLKYSRIYMMEMPLTLLSALGGLYLYDFLHNRDKKSFLLTSLLLGASVLIKGPVSLAMAFGSGGLYALYSLFIYKKNVFPPLLLAFISSFLLGSLWFLASSLVHGIQFLEYFFIRENLGKFSSRAYPIQNVFQGLLLYSLPWTLYIPYAFFGFKDQKFQDFKVEKKSPEVFLIASFLLFFSLWLLPNQRSHHYAIPSIPFFISLIYLYVFRFPVKQKWMKLWRFGNSLTALLCAVLFIALLIPYFFSQISTNPKIVLLLLATQAALALCIYFFLRPKTHHHSFRASILLFGPLWVLLIPAFSLPQMPSSIIQEIGLTPLGVVVQKPYFVAEALGRPIDILNEDQILPFIKGHRQLYLVHEELYEKLNMNIETNILRRWSVWRRGRSVKHLLAALEKRDLSELQENLVLLKNK